MRECGKILRTRHQRSRNYREIMKKLLAIFALMTLAAPPAAAAEPMLAANTAPTSSATQTTGKAVEQLRAENPLQALCREIFVDVDEGYGVTSKQPRTVCEEPR